MAWDYCTFLRDKAKRGLRPYYLQHLKVVYREIIMDKYKFNGKTTHTMLKEMIEDYKTKCNQDELNIENIEALFMLDKLSRGFHREKGGLTNYILVAEIREVYYAKLLKIYQYTNIDAAISELLNLVKVLDMVLRNMLSKN